MTFDRAVDLVPYLKELGISHLYASPIFSATSGSTHGYDIIDANAIDPSIGGREGFDRLTRTLKEAGLGLILDIVPNHMAASLENPWWRDIVENGEGSRYSRYFDIDWSQKLTLPNLGTTFAEALEAGEITVKRDPATGKPALAYYETLYPLGGTGDEGPGPETLRMTDKAETGRLHDQQPYKLIYWRDAHRALSYRRFFEITGLVGVRVEDPVVFGETHKLILELVRDGVVEGLRVDHVDGLADPKAYLEHLREATGPDCYIIVEKILGEAEHIPTSWPVAGTTGYEFIATLSRALVDPDKLQILHAGYEAFTGEPLDMTVQLRNAKLQMADHNFAVEVENLLRLAMRIEQEADLEPRRSKEALKSALRELLVAFPVYRTYGTMDDMPAEGAGMLRDVLATVRQGPNAPPERELGLLEHILLCRIPSQAADLAGEFRVRFQQLTGPLMAKSVEDTLFFRQHVLLSLNEVGAEPRPGAFTIERFHQEMRLRLERQPNALSATSTHDTKRGEDARARLHVLSETPGLWLDAVNRWHEMNTSAITRLADGAAPEPAVEWMLYQALAGAWPPYLQPGDREQLELLEKRLLVYAEKALREAKLRTNWSDINKPYEEAVASFVRHLLAPDNSLFLVDFVQTLGPFISAGHVNSLTQTVIKLTAPGVPDIYQGSEALDLSLVDPDNRREPDFEDLQARLRRRDKNGRWFAGEDQFEDLKQSVIMALLDLRQREPALFRTGDYVPLAATGPCSANILAFARTDARDALIVITARHVFDKLHDGLAEPHADCWSETDLVLPEELRNRPFEDVCGGGICETGATVNVGRSFAGRYFAVLRSL